MLKACSFPVCRRIRERLDFKRTFRKGVRTYSPFYILYYCHNNLGYSRIGVIVSKRSAKKAVLRNKIKRVARESFRLQQNQLQSIDIVLIAQKKSSGASKDELRRCLETLFGKLLKYS